MSVRRQHRRHPGGHHPRDVGVRRRHARGGRARRCRSWRRGTRRSRPARAGTRRWWSGRGSRCRRGRATSAWRAVSRSGPWATTLPSIGSYDVLTTWPLSSAWSTRTPSPAGHRTRLAVPAWGRKPPNESSAYTRASIACPWSVRSSWPSDSGSPAATRSCCSTRSSSPPRLAPRLGDRVLDLEPGVHLQEVEVTGGVVEQELDGAGVGVADLAREVDGRARDALRGGRRRWSARAPPRAPSGGDAGSSSRARRGGRRSRGCRRAPAPRCGARTRRTSRPASCRRRRRCVPRASRPRAPRRTRRRMRTTRIPLPPPPAAALTSTG